MRRTRGGRGGALSASSFAAARLTASPAAVAGDCGLALDAGREGGVPLRHHPRPVTASLPRLHTE